MRNVSKILYAPLHDEKSVIIDETVGEPISSIWLFDPVLKQYKVVFVMDKAQQIHDHLFAWADNKPEEYFSAHWTHDDVLSVLALIPNVEKALSRIKAVDASLNGDVQVASRYIASISKINEIKCGGLDSEVFVNIAMIDPEFMDKGEWDVSYLDHVLDIGKFRILKNTNEANTILYDKYHSSITSSTNLS